MAYRPEGTQAVAVRDSRSGAHVLLKGLASISSDGRFIGNTESDAAYSVLDTTTGEVIPAAVTTSGEKADWPIRTTAYEPVMSADGRFMAFDHGAANLVSGDGNEKVDVFVRDLVSKTTERVSVSSSGEEGDGHSQFPSISADGNLVLFVSEATNLVPGDTNGGTDLFLRDRHRGTTVRIVEAVVRIGSTKGAISADGRVVAFPEVLGSTSSDILVSVLEVGTGRRTRVNMPPGGIKANGGTFLGQPLPISADGTCLAFGSGATNLIPGENATGLFVRDLTSGALRRVEPSGSALRLEQVAMFPEGTAVAFTSFGQIYVHDLVASTTTKLGSSVPERLPVEPHVACASARVVGSAQARTIGGVAVAYASQSEEALGLYSVRRDRSSVISTEPHWGIDGVRFRSAGAITFAIQGGDAGDVICDLTLKSASIRELFRDLDSVGRHDWSPDGTELAYIGLKRQRQPRAVVFVAKLGRKPIQIADLGRWHGNHHAEADGENGITWSPDGKLILVTATDAGVRGTVNVLDRNGRRLIRPRYGTLGRWVSSNEVLFRDRYGRPDGQGRWYMLDVDSDSAQPLGIQPGTVRPTVSTDGRFVAYDDSARVPGLFLFDFQTQTERVIARGYVDPAWLGDGVLSVLKTSPCDDSEPDECFSDRQWIPAGKYRWAIDIADGAITRTALPWVRWFDVRLI